jgi:hypothetical protein
LSNETWTQPLNEVRLGKFTGGQSKHCIDRLGWLWLIQTVSISLNEFDHRQPRCALVSVRQRMVFR